MTKNDAKYKTIFEVTPIPIWEEDFSGIKNLLIEKGLYGQDPTFVNDTLRNDRDLVLEFISVIKIVDFNDACVRLHHAKSKEDLKENFHALFTPEGYELVVKQLVTISQGLTSFEDESTTRTLDGKHKNISFKWKVVPGFEDSLKSVIITTEDITEEEILKQGLKELLKRYHLVTKATFEAIYDWDLATDMLIWGEGFRSIFGYQFDKIKPDYSTWKDNIHPDDVKDVIENVEAYLKSEDDNWQKEYRFRKANGQYVHVIDKSFVLRDLDGNVLRMVGALQDISEIKQANDELKSRSQFIQTTLDNIPIGIAVNEISSGKVTLMNKKFSEIYGWPQSELEDVDSFFKKVYSDPIYRNEMAEKIRSDIQSGDPERMNWSGIRITTQKGEERVISAKNIPLYDQNLMIFTIIDETERYLAEKKLDKSNERFLYASKAVSDAIWDCDLESGQIFWGPGYHTLFGYPPEMKTVDESFCNDTIHPDDFEGINNSIEETRKNQEADKWTGEYRFRKYNGEYAYVKEKTIILRNSTGNPIRMVGALQDISEQKMFEEKLSQERNLLRTLIDNIPDYIFVKDKQLRQIINNKANLKLLGAGAEEETIGKTAYDYFPKELADLYQQDDLIVLENGKSIIDREDPVIDRNGNKKWLLTSKIPLFNPKGESMGLVGISRDITRRKQREQSLISKTILLETIAEVVKLLLFNENWKSAFHDCLELMGKAVQVDRVYFFENTLDPKTNKLYSSQIMEWVNENISPELNNPDNQGIALDDHPILFEGSLNNRVIAFFTRQLEDKTREILEKQNIKSILQIPVYINDLFHGFIGFDDCTKERIWSEEEISFLQTLGSNLAAAIERKNNLDSLKKLNEELQNSNLELDISNKELERFAYVASHDLQEPLRMITSFLGQFEKKYGEILDEKGKKYIFFAVDGAKRMKSIIFDLLEYSRVGRMGDPINPVNLNQLMEEVKSLLKVQIEETKASIDFTELPEINSQKSQLRQVIQNIISNAIKYRRKGVDPIIKLDVNETDTHWKFVISDNGIGIADEYFERIFVIFQRLHNKEEYSGTGIGLAICKKIIENLGGKIWVESEENKGSRFLFILPKKAQIPT